MFRVWLSKHIQLQQKARTTLVFCDQCGEYGDYTIMRNRGPSPLGLTLHTCGGHFQFSQTTTMQQYQQGLSADQQAILDDEISQCVNRTIPQRLKEDEEHIQAACEVLDLLHNTPAHKHTEIERIYGFPQIDSLNLPDRFPSCPYCQSKWIGPKPRLTHIYGIPIPKWVYPTPEPPCFCFRCRTIIP